MLRWACVCARARVSSHRFVSKSRAKRRSSRSVPSLPFSSSLSILPNRKWPDSSWKPTCIHDRRGTRLMEAYVFNTTKNKISGSLCMCITRRGTRLVSPRIRESKVSWQFPHNKFLNAICNRDIAALNPRPDTNAHSLCVMPASEAQEGKKREHYISLSINNMRKVLPTMVPTTRWDKSHHAMPGRSFAEDSRKKNGTIAPGKHYRARVP